MTEKGPPTNAEAAAGLVEALVVTLLTPPAFTQADAIEILDMVARLCFEARDKMVKEAFEDANQQTVETNDNEPSAQRGETDTEGSASTAQSETPA